MNKVCWVYGPEHMEAETRIDDFDSGGGLAVSGNLTAVEAYGPEVLGFLVTFLRDMSKTRAEVFSQAMRRPLGGARSVRGGSVA